jgi:acetyl esterase/lipase
MRGQRILTVLLGAMLSLWFLPLQARAGDSGSSLSTQLQSESLSEDGAEALVASMSGSQSYSQSDYDACPPADQSERPTFPDITYKTFIPGGSSTEQPIKLDEYDPPTSITGPFTVMVLAHGGGFWRGCKTTLQDVAWEGSGQDAATVLYKYFIVLAIDFRLACDPSDPNLVGSPIQYLCGWAYPKVDPVTQRWGATIQDVQSAVTWVTSTWSHLSGRPAWDHRVVLLGGSSGGTFAYSAVAPSTNVGGAVTVNAVAGWSGALRLDLMTNGYYPCDPSQSNGPGECQTAHQRYLGCSNATYPNPECVYAGRYSDASPNTWYTNTNLPHAFFANGGGGTGGNELVALQSALDFEGTLTGTLGWHLYTEYVKCIVDQPIHGRALRTQSCDDGRTGTVWYRTSSFLYGVPV